MWILFVSLVALALVAMTLGYFRNRRIRRLVSEGKLEAFPEVKAPDGECCGQHAVCEKDSLLAAASKSVEYYDDEELDEYAGIPSDQYTEEQTDRFRDVLYTMRESDVAGWSRSLQLRGINLPDPLRDEVFLIVGERRFHPTH